MAEQLKKIPHFDIPLDDKGFLVMDEIKSLINTWINQNDFSSALNFLNQIKSNVAIQSTSSIIELHDLYIQILLDIEDYPSLLNILKSKEKYLEHPKEKNMHLFYMAICYEGLNDIHQAIESLEKIQDILSNKNMANKYIKLAILYASQNKLKEAKDALKHAEIFDRSKDNEMFLLAESDIYYQAKEYDKAMKVYEDFFIKTKRQMAYLNRFIKISLALNRTTDVYEFYLRYKDKVIESSSIQTKLSFFNEVIDLLKTFYQQEYIEVNDIIETLKQREVIDFDDFGYFQTILKQSNRHKIYQQEREVVRDFFMDLDETKAFKKLIYVKVIDATLHLWHYSKQLLLEKTHTDDHMITHDLIHHKTQQTYGKTDSSGFLFVDDDVDAIFVEQIQDDAYFLGYTSTENYDLAKRLSILSSGLLSQKVDHFKLLKTYLQHDEGFRGLIDQKSLGFIKVHENHVVCLNDQANTLLKTTKDVFPFNDFQAMMTPMIYLDELAEKHHFEVTIDGQKMTLTTHVVDVDVFVLIEKVTQPTTNEWQPDQNHSLVMMDVFNHHELKHHMGYQPYMEQFNQLKQAMAKATNHHMIDLLSEDDHQLLMLLDTRDKRIFDRLDQKLYKIGFDAFDLRMAYHHFNQSFHETKDKCHQLLSYTTMLNKKQSGDQPIRKEEERNGIYLDTIQNLLQRKSLPLIHAYIKEWKTKKVTHIDIDVHHMSILFDQSRVEQILKVNGLEILFDRLLVNQVIEDAKSYQHKTCFIIPISMASIASKKAFNYLLRRLEKIDHQYYFKLSIDHYLMLSEKDQRYLLDKEIPMALFGDINNVLDLESLERQKMYIMSYRMFQRELFEPWFDMIQKRFEMIVYDHQDQQLKSSALETRHIELVKGAFSGIKSLETS